MCHSYSAHLYERLGAELGYDGMNMKHAFCEELVDACETQPSCPTHDSGEDYCYVHAGDGHDYFWSYPYTEREQMHRAKELRAATKNQRTTRKIKEQGAKSKEQNIICK